MHGITVGSGCPYPPTGMTTALWTTLEPEVMWWCYLTTTQDGVSVSGLLSPTPRDGSDSYPHVVEHCGKLYLEDGHCRVLRSILSGGESGLVRVLHR